MIQRSQRGKQPQTSESRPVNLTLHERIASRRLWFLRLMTASTAALALSFVLWLFRVPLEVHLGGIALGFIAGLFARRRMQSWALSWIRERSGLSYETALEQRSRADDFGFSETLQQRATEEVSRLAPPKYQVWWLPMLAVALGLAFLPLIPSVAELAPPFNRPTTTTPTPTATNQPNPSEPNQPTATEAANEPIEANSSASPMSSTGETNASDLNNPGGPSNTSANQNNQNADEAALERFLDNLQENEPTPSDSPDVDLSSVMPQQSQGSPSSNEDNASRPRNEQTNPFERPGEQQEGQSGANQNSEQGQGEEQEQNEGAQNQQGQQPQSQADPAQSEQGQGEEQTSGGEDQSEQGEGVGNPQSTGQEGEQNQEGSGQNSSAQGEGNEQNSDLGQNAEGAGSLPGNPTGQSEEVVGESQQSPEFLQGRVDEGLNNTAGTVRLPGETSQTVFPEGSAPGSFSRAEEEALTEGRIPLEYQEVIRNYFRSNP